jgi:hypothetical protein
VTQDLDARLKAKREARRAKSHTAGDEPAGGDDEPRRKSKRRFETLNQFVFLVGPRLSLAERWVWQVMFTHAKDGVCLTSVRQLEKTGVSCSTAAKALKRLCELKLVWPIWLSRDKSTPSKYGVHPNPSECLAPILADQEPYRSSVRMKR